MIFINSF